MFRTEKDEELAYWLESVDITVFAPLLMIVTISTYTLKINVNIAVNVNVITIANYGKTQGKEKEKPLQMGMSSSQARLLSITSRVHSLELKAQRLQAAKLRLANDSDKAYSEYLDGLEAKKLQFKTIDGNGSISFVDATYNILKAHGYEIKLDSEDKEVITPETEAHFLAARSAGGRDYFAALETGRVSLTSNVYDDGSGAGPVHEVYTVDQFISNISSPGGCNKIVLMTDLDMSGTGYTPQTLNGINLDGNGHTISGLSTSLFSTITGSSQVKNLRINNSGTTINSTGLLAREIYNSTISNVAVSGNISTGAGNTGGLAGAINSATIEKCSFTGSINVSGGVYSGGLIGFAANSSISNCSAKGVLNVNKIVGGFVGCAESSNINYSSSDMQITADADGVAGNPDSGGFIAVIAGTTVVDHCQAKGSFTDTTNTKTTVIGGFFGCTGSDSVNSVISNSTTSVNITTDGVQVCGFGSAYSGGSITFENCNYTGTTLSSSNSENCAFAYVSPVSGSIPASSMTVTNCYSSNHAYAFTNNGDTGISAPNAILISPTPPSISTSRTLCGSGISDKQAQFDRLLVNGYTTMASSDPRITFGDNPKWLENMLEAGMLIILKPDENGNLIETSVANDTNLQQVADETDVKRLEAKYEADMRAINRKDQEYDTKLSVCETERSALTNEMETLKSVAKDNVSMSFKLFG